MISKYKGRPDWCQKVYVGCDKVLRDVTRQLSAKGSVTVQHLRFVKVLTHSQGTQKSQEALRASWDTLVSIFDKDDPEDDWEKVEIP